MNIVEVVVGTIRVVKMKEHLYFIDNSADFIDRVVVDSVV